MNVRNMKYQAGTRTATGDALTHVNNEVSWNHFNIFVLKLEL
jgi:hypothetical protein